MSEMIHLKGLFITIYSDFCFTGQVPEISIADDTGERRKFAIRNLRSDSTSEVVHSCEISEVELSDRALSIRILFECLAQLLRIHISI